MKSLFKITSIATTVLFLFLFAQFLFTSEAFIRGLGLTPDSASIILIRRASVFLLGYAVLIFLSRNLPPSKARNYLSISMAVTFFCLAINGIYGFIYGNYNSSIFIAISIELLLGFAFTVNIIIDRKYNTDAG